MNKFSSWKLKQILRKNFLIFLVVFLSLFFILSVFLIYQNESPANKNISVFDAFRMGLVYFLGEYGAEPSTAVGKAISLILFVWGVLLGALVIGKITSVLVSFKLEEKMPKDTDGHIVICNWNNGGDRIILNPKESEFHILEKGDRLLVISFDQPDLIN